MESWIRNLPEPIPSTLSLEDLREAHDYWVDFINQHTEEVEYDQKAGREKEDGDFFSKNESFRGTLRAACWRLMMITTILLEIDRLDEQQQEDERKKVLMSPQRQTLALMSLRHSQLMWQRLKESTPALPMAQQQSQENQHDSLLQIKVVATNKQSSSHAQPPRLQWEWSVLRGKSPETVSRSINNQENDGDDNNEVNDIDNMIPFMTEEELASEEAILLQMAYTPTPDEL